MRILKKPWENAAVKVLAFIVTIACVVVFLISGVAVKYNVTNEWYSKGSDKAGAEIRIKDEIAEYIASEIDRNIGSYEIDPGDYYEEDGEYEDSDELAALDFEGIGRAEFFTGERDSAGFGYAIYQASGKGAGKYADKPVKEIKVDKGKYNDSDLVTVTRKYDPFKTTVSIATTDPKDLPEEAGRIAQLLNTVYNLRITALVCFIGSLILGLFTGINLLRYAGYKKDKTWIRYIPIDALLVAVIGIIGGFTAGLADTAGYIDNLDAIIFAWIGLSAGATAVLGAYCVLFSARVKLGKWWQSTVIYQCVRGAKWLSIKLFKAFSYLPFIWKTVIGFFLALILCLATPVLGWFAVAVLVFYTTVCLKRIKTGASAMAAGDIDNKIDTKGLFFDIKEHAEDLNRIRDGINVAVEDRMKSERMKTELITNVSHDIKTPLTSIINYVDLLKSEDIDSETADEYIEVIDRQSQRLKKLIEDLIEASKASTGNVEMVMGPCSVSTIMAQTNGEYQEKAKKSDLKLVLDTGDRDVMITADGRSMWRIFDNLMSNIIKYSQPGTRVYQTLRVEDGKAVITYKNTSNYELNISPEELTERFVRGDESRHTEGSGLGLSIARNLTELQGGDFRIEIDGDLFKAVLIFDIRQ